jgi:hypothetical protein
MPKRSPLSLAAMLVVAVVLGPGAALAAPDDVGGPPITWTLSSSPADPYVNDGIPLFGVLDLYLWAIPVGIPGWEVACFDFAATGSLFFLTVIPGLGVQYVDGCFHATDCPDTPRVVAIVQCLDLTGEICFAPHPTEARNCTTDCNVPPQAWENSWIGYTSAGLGPPCQYETWAPCAPVSVEPDSWARIKAGYR